jgi:hypothetical protein
MAWHKGRGFPLEVNPGFRKRVPFPSSVGVHKITNHFVGENVTLKMAARKDLHQKILLKNCEWHGTCSIMNSKETLRLRIPVIPGGLAGRPPEWLGAWADRSTIP